MEIRECTTEYTYGVFWLKSVKATALSCILAIFRNCCTETTVTAGHVCWTEKARRSQERCHALQQSCFVAWLIPLVGGCSDSRPAGASHADGPFARHMKNQPSLRAPGRVETRGSWSCLITRAMVRVPRGLLLPCSLPSSASTPPAAAASISGKMSTRLRQRCEDGLLLRRCRCWVRAEHSSNACSINKYVGPPYIVGPKCKLAVSHAMLSPGESRWVCRRDRQTDGRTDGRQTVTLRFQLDAISVITDIMIKVPLSGVSTPSLSISDLDVWLQHTT